MYIGFVCHHEGHNPRIYLLLIYVDDILLTISWRLKTRLNGAVYSFEGRQMF